ncbi:MAG: nitroreductase family protein [Planctomycetota bacterium]|jgi:nitroreductase
MEVIEAIRKRYSCRAYHDRPIEREKLETVLEAARLAPSAKNLQDWRFVVVTDKQTRRRLAEAANNQRFLENAGAIIIACSNSDYVMRCNQPVAPIDVAIALEHIALQAAQLGLASCWIGSFYPEKVRAILDIPADIAVIELMPLGYPADRQKPPTREPMDRIVCYEKWRF